MHLSRTLKTHSLTFDVDTSSTGSKVAGVRENRIRRREENENHSWPFFQQNRPMMKGSLAFWLVLLFEYAVLVHGAASASRSCPFPSKFKSNYDFDWQRRNNEWRNVDSPIDYFVLSLSWWVSSRLRPSASHSDQRASLRLLSGHRRFVRLSLLL